MCRRPVQGVERPASSSIILLLDMHRFEDFAPHESFEQFLTIRAISEIDYKPRCYLLGSYPGLGPEKHNGLYRIQVASRAEPPSRRNFDLA